jgi:hypothetical protein
MIARLYFYLLPIFMAVYPVVFLSVKKAAVRLLLLGLIIFFTLYQFYFFFQSDVWRKAFGTYHTIFSAPAFF